MFHYEKEALKQLPEASSWPKFFGTGEYDHMELIDYIYGLFIDLPSIPDYWITARLNTEFKGHASIWYTEMKEIKDRKSWPWWKSKSIQKYRNDEESQTPDTNARRTRVCSKIQMQKSCTLDVIANTLQDVRKRTNMGKYSPYESIGFKEKQPFRVELQDKPRESVAEVAKKKDYCHNCGSTGHYANNCPKAKKKVPEEESPTEDYESDTMGDSIGEQSDDDHDPREELLVEYQEETLLEIQDIQLEAGMPQDTSNKSL
ncbi:hypothetical protein O181_000514 [Austropuccinia psidii MF-1]|uniref:CCHC-type domain-containing protein n=1 Tax=Austropuccinia psidii MF-1 TaxID=1389203 RepID=A0A9Q3B8R1_9BASI|nr:hypothetical protein [Austropuccinia psidii MF-1]